MMEALKQTGMLIVLVLLSEGLFVLSRALGTATNIEPNPRRRWSSLPARFCARRQSMLSVFTRETR